MQQLQQQIIEKGLSEKSRMEEINFQKQIDARDKKTETLIRKKKSRVQWLQEGDWNTKFFHRSTIQRWQTNRITSLKHEQCNKLIDHVDLEHRLVNYFKDVLMETKSNQLEAIQKITKNIPKLVSRKQNDALLRPTTMEEIEHEVMDMPKGKSPGPDDFMVDFFQVWWPILKKEVLELMEDTRSFTNILPTLNATFLTLIPEDKFEDPSKFIPISLCNVVYKLITKFIANHLNLILHHLISQE